MTDDCIDSRHQGRIAIPRLRLASFNIASINGKRVELAHMLDREKIDIIALQETRRSRDDWRISISGFNCVESLVSTHQASNGLARAKGPEPGRNGLAILVRDDIRAHQVGIESGYWIFLRLCGGPIPTPFLVGNIYRPHDKATSEGVIAGMKKQIGLLRSKFPDDPIIIMGDWNWVTSEMDEIREWSPVMECLKVDGESRTFHSRGQEGDIDHIIIDQDHLQMMSDASVLRNWDLSDHWPIVASMSAAHYKKEVPVAKERMKGVPLYSLGAYKYSERPQISDQWDAIKESNYWDPLSDMLDECDDDGEDIDGASEAFIYTSFEVARSLGMTSVSNGKKEKRRELLTKSQRKKMDERRAKFHGLQQLPEGEEKEVARNEYKAIKNELRTEIRQYQRRRWLEWTTKMACQATSDPKKAWRRLSELGGYNDRSGQSGPAIIKDENGRLLTEVNDVGAAWVRHFRRLAADNSKRGRDYWRKVVKDLGLPHRVELDADFTIKEMNAAVKKLKLHKAPGEDNITAEWMKKMLPYFNSGDDDVTDFPSKMAQVVWKLLNAIWKSGHIPSCWRRTSLVTILKKGDPLEMDNYRGISLLPMPFKVLLIMVTTRIERCLEAHGLLAREQAGFRASEECAGQVAALVETVQRRSIEGKPTFLLFVDLTKAYDTVPHEALFAKMDQIGIRGRMLDFIRSLYASSEICLRIPGYDAEPFLLERGLRQGCPMSPILFDIFINDIYGEPGQLRFDMGVSIPGVPMLVEGRLSGLLFADDLVGMSETILGVEKQAKRISQWCDTWEMGVGIKKCGVMCMWWRPGKGTYEVERLANAEQANLRVRPPTISGLKVPVVEEYTYLGVVVTRDLDFKAMVSGRCKRAEKAMYMILPLLRAQSVPLALRVSVLRTVVLSTLLYGSEIWGMNDSLCKQAQNIVNQALRAIMGHKRGDMAQPCAAMWRELDVPPVCAMAAARRARAIRKFPGLKTWIGTLGQYDHRSRKRAWMARSRVWLKQNCPDDMTDGDDDQEQSADNEQKMTRSVMNKRWTDCEKTVKWKVASGVYLDSGFGETTWASIKDIMICARAEQVRLGRGLCMLSQCRTNGFWTARKRSRAGLITNRKYKRTCPCCNIRGEKGETVEHILIECQRWKEERERYMGNIIRDIMAMGPVEQKDMVTLLLGGESSGRRLVSWLPSSSTTSEAITCGAFQVARFLQCISSDRAAILREIPHKGCSVE